VLTFVVDGTIVEMSFEEPSVPPISGDLVPGPRVTGGEGAVDMSTTDRDDEQEIVARGVGDGDGAGLLIRPYGGRPFELRGVVDGRTASAETLEASMVVDEALFLRARRLVEERARFALPDYQLCFDATVEGDGPAVALTLLRSFDRIVSVRMSLDVAER
jgi:hypothetical protein